MKKSFIYIGIVFPLAAALISGICLFAAVYPNAARLSPVNQGIPLALHDSLNPGNEEHYEPGITESNDLIGTIKSSDDIALRYDADYANLIDCASLNKKSADVDGTGCLYVYAGIQNMAKISTDEPLTLAIGGKEYSYRYTGEQLVKSETEALNLAPEHERSMIIYYRVSNGIGLTTDYYALIFKGVE